MAKVAKLPPTEPAPEGSGAEIHRIARPQVRYYAFLSYSHKDEALAEWLHSQLEEFRVPSTLAGKLTANGVIPKRLTPIFRDEHELAAADDLGEEIEEALAASQFLIVLCSAEAAASHWTNAEIELFKRIRPEGCILAAIAAGEPFASEMPGREAEECFPPALRQKYDRRGRPTGKRAEPLAADLREEGEGRRLGFLKLVAGMLGVGLDDLVQRETTRRHRRLAWLAAASVAGMAVTSTLAFTAIRSRDEAREQRRQAEGLVAFMLGDLRDKLEPIGRLDALDGVGSRVLAYYSKQDRSQLSDAALLQRSRALNLTAEVAYSRGNMDEAQRLYSEAMAGTAEAIRRDPDDPQRVFDHAQNVFWISAIARNRGDVRTEERAARDYRNLTLRLVQLDPDNMKWRVEQESALANLGVVLFEQRRFAEAADQFTQALRTVQALQTADPGNRDYQKSSAEILAWLADSQWSAGEIDQGIAYRRQHVALLNAWLAQSGGDVSYRLKLIPAHRALGNLYAARGQFDAAIGELRTATGIADKLTPMEPNNRQWMEYSANAHLNLGEGLLAAGRAEESAKELGAGCGLVDRLIGFDAQLMQWRIAQRYCLMLQARLALQTGANDRALGFAQRAVATAKRVKSPDVTADRHALAKSYRLLGDALRARGDSAGAGAAWSAALASLPNGVAERPAEMSERSIILRRLGRSVEARPLTARLDQIGYRTVA